MKLDDDHVGQGLIDGSIHTPLLHCTVHPPWHSP
jgi:hypothetical protein